MEMHEDHLNSQNNFSNELESHVLRSEVEKAVATLKIINFQDQTELLKS